MDINKTPNKVVMDRLDKIIKIIQEVVDEQEGEKNGKINADTK